MLDVLIAGAGPAGTVAAIQLARAGARVVIVDRETFPRQKCCGDMLSPGAVRALGSIGISGGPLADAARLTGVAVRAGQRTVVTDYPPGGSGLVVSRRVLDTWLLELAMQAGARFESGLVVTGPLVDRSGGREMVRGLVVSRRNDGTELRLPALSTIAADGAPSVLARESGLAPVRQTDRSSACVALATGIRPALERAEIHLTHRAYIELVPSGPDRATVCVVQRQPCVSEGALDMVRRAMATDPVLTARFADARFSEPARMVESFVFDVNGTGVPGLLLAGDAAGAANPVTGDGVFLAIEGGRLAAEVTLRTLESGDFVGAPGRLAEARGVALGGRLRFGRVVRAVVGARGAVALISGMAPGVVQRAVAYAGGTASPVGRRARL